MKFSIIGLIVMAFLKASMFILFAVRLVDRCQPTAFRSKRAIIKAGYNHLFPAHMQVISDTHTSFFLILFSVA